VYWVTTIVTYTAPTRTEINLGKDISGEISEINGFTVNSDQVPTPDLSGRFVPSVVGRITPEASSINFYSSSTGFTDARSVMPRDTTGFLIFMDGGDISTTGRMDVAPCTVGSVSKNRGLDDPATVTISYVITRDIATDVVIPA